MLYITLLIKLFLLNNKRILKQMSRWTRVIESAIW